MPNIEFSVQIYLIEFFQELMMFYFVQRMSNDFMAKKSNGKYLKYIGVCSSIWLIE